MNILAEHFLLVLVFSLQLLTWIIFRHLLVGSEYSEDTEPKRYKLRFGDVTNVYWTPKLFVFTLSYHFVNLLPGVFLCLAAKKFPS